MEDEIPIAPVPAVDDTEPETMTESNPTVRFDAARSFTKRSLENDEEEEIQEAGVLDQSQGPDRRGPGPGPAAGG